MPSRPRIVILKSIGDGCLGDYGLTRSTAALDRMLGHPTLATSNFERAPSPMKWRLNLSATFSPIEG
jgi:hypothetical protein